MKVAPWQALAAAALIDTALVSVSGPVEPAAKVPAGAAVGLGREGQGGQDASRVAAVDGEPAGALAGVEDELTDVDGPALGLVTVSVTAAEPPG